MLSNENEKRQCRCAGGDIRPKNNLKINETSEKA